MEVDESLPADCQDEASKRDEIPAEDEENEEDENGNVHDEDQVSDEDGDDLGLLSCNLLVDRAAHIFYTTSNQNCYEYSGSQLFQTARFPSCPPRTHELPSDSRFYSPMSLSSPPKKSIPVARTKTGCSMTPD